MLKRKKTYLLAFLMLLLPIAVMAGPGDNGANIGANWVFNIINNLLYMVVWPVFVAISIGMFGWAGFLYLTAQGDVTKVTTAHKAVVFAIIGIIIVLLSYGYMNYLRNSLNNRGGAGGAPGGGNGNAQRVCCSFGEDPARGNTECSLQTQETCRAPFEYRANLTSCTPNPCGGGAGGGAPGGGDVNK